MKLQEIDKSRYRKHLNIVIAVCIVALTALSLGISQSVIYLFTDREGTHFWINLLGVAIALAVIGTTLSKNRHKPFMTEVVYVWNLKQNLNLIQRKLTKIEAAREQLNVDAIIIMYFYYAACRQLYTLDDNTITMTELTLKANALDRQIEELNLSVTTDDFTQNLLDQF